jgi:hypothetical protein
MVVTAAAVDAELRGQLHFGAPAIDAPADQNLVVACPVLVGGVEEGDTEVDRAVNGSDGRVPIGGAVVLAHAHASQPLRGNVQVTELYAVHGCPFPFIDVLSALPLPVGTPAAYGFAGFNGRALADNAPEAMLSLVSGTAVPSGLTASVSAPLRAQDFPFVVPVKA